MTVEEIADAATKVQAIVVGGTDVKDLFATAKIVSEVETQGMLPLLCMVPSDLYLTLFDDGDFADNAQKFSEIQNKHVRLMLEEYAAWKVLQQNAKKAKK